jgi:hypothetical protein
MHMARSRLTNTSQDLISDGGAVIWSFVKGEQLEFPITLNFVEDASVKANNNYQYEAVVVEAANVVAQTDRPTTVKTGGVQTTLFVRLPIYLGEWQSAQAYNKEEVVRYSNKYYKLTQGSARTSSVLPTLDPYWEETVLNKIYVQFPSTLASNWSVQAFADNAVYGFFELRVTEPVDPVFTRTFKPVRGMIEILFSPTSEVTDAAAPSRQTQPL